MVGSASVPGDAMLRVVCPILKHSIAKVRGNQNDSNMKGTHHLLVYADDVTLPG